MLQLWIGCLQKWLAWVAFQAELEKREPFNIFFLKSPRSEQLINSKHYALVTKAEGYRASQVCREDQDGYTRFSYDTEQ
jgi:hypothetical protein